MIFRTAAPWVAVFRAHMVVSVDVMGELCLLGEYKNDEI